VPAPIPHAEPTLPLSFGPVSSDRAVRYGGWLFSAPAALAGASGPGCAGLYAVQVVNPTWTPCPFEPIYFGHAADLAARAAAATHQAFGRWIAHPRAGTGLFVSFAALPCTSDDVRRNIVGGLVSTYRPAANIDDGPSRGLLGLAD
jgi:hypothetical protein